MVYAIDFSNINNNPLAKFANIGIILNVIIPLITVGGLIIFFAMMIMAGLTLITAGGNPETLKKAQQTLQFAFIGLIIVIFAYLIVKLIGVFFNIKMPI